MNGGPFVDLSEIRLFMYNVGFCNFISLSLALDIDLHPGKNVGGLIPVGVSRFE